MDQEEMLDNVDAKILSILSKDGRITCRDLAGQIGLSLSPTIRRMRQLEESGLIRGYTAILDENRLAGSINALVSVSLDKQSAGAAFEAEVEKIPHVVSCYLMTGGADYLLRAIVRDLKEFHALVVGPVTKIRNVAHIQTTFAVKAVFERTSPTISAADGQTRARRRQRP